MNRPFDDNAAVVESDSDVDFLLASDHLLQCRVGPICQGERCATELCRPVPLGRTDLDYITEPDRVHYARAFQRALAHEQTCEEHLYECSPDRHRQFRHKVLPLIATITSARHQLLCGGTRRSACPLCRCGGVISRRAWPHSDALWLPLHLATRFRQGEIRSSIAHLDLTAESPSAPPDGFHIRHMKLPVGESMPFVLWRALLHGDTVEEAIHALESTDRGKVMSSGSCKRVRLRQSKLKR